MTTEQKTETKGIIPILEVPTEIYDWLKKKADAQGIDIGQVIADLITESAPSECSEPKQEIEYEQVTIRVPTPIMDFLREHEKDMGMTAKEYIEYNVIGTVRADLDAGDVFYPSAKEIAENWDLNPIFKVVLNDPVTI